MIETGQGTAIADANGAPSAGRPERWRAVAAAIRNQIERDDLPPGSKLATEMQLAVAHGVSRFTVRRALAELQEQDVVRIDHGRGLFVAERVLTLKIGRRTRLNENFRRLNVEGGRRYVGAFIDDADAQTREGLGLAPGAEVLVVQLLSFVNDRPIGLARNHFPIPRFRGLELEVERRGSVTAALGCFGIADYVRKTSRVTSRMPRQEEAELLQMRRSQPLITSVKVDSDLDGTPICYGESCYPGDRVALVFE